MKVSNIILTAAACLLLPATSFAVAIDGELGIAGTLSPTCSVDPSPDPCTMGIADGLTFADSGLGNEFLVEAIFT